MNSTMNSQELRGQLWNHLRIHRERGVSALLNLAESNINDAMELVHESFRDTEGNDDSPWERQHGGLMAIGKFAAKGLLDGPSILNMAAYAVDLLSHPEPRIREEAGLTLGALSAVPNGPDVFGDVCKDAILVGIGSNLTRSSTDTAKEVKLLEKFSEAKNKTYFSTKLKRTDDSLPADSIFHESAGWKTLETSSRALLAVAKGQGPSFSKHITEDVVELVYRSLKHTNRFVRETAYYICGVFSDALHSSNAASTEISVSSFDNSMCTAIATGLADNWSQVRMAASVAARRFLFAIEPAERGSFAPTLLPRMALNRYYVAEGVRLYSQETWKEMFGQQGKDLVEQYMDEVVKYYITSANAENHAVREAACACIAELGLKASSVSVEPFVPKLLRVLLTCFRDESWPVRDASCIASGRFLKCFPDHGREFLPEFLDLYMQHMADNIWSVRQNAAESLGAMVQAYGDEVFQQIEPKVVPLLLSATEQGSQSTQNARLQNVTTFGVAKPAASMDSPIIGLQNPVSLERNRIVEEGVDGGPRRIRYKFGDEDPLHSNQQLFSCGSLAPKLRAGGCMDCNYVRPQEPWEKSDGCVYFLKELSKIRPDYVNAQLTHLSTIAQLRDFKHHFNLLETIWKQLPEIAAGIGKRSFKAHLEQFIPSLHYTLVSQNQLARAAAEDCVAALAKLIGVSILRGRVEMVDPRFCEAFDHAQQVASHPSAVPVGGVAVRTVKTYDTGMPRTMMP